MSNQQKSEPWRNAERHYCAVCNAWMGSDRQSILIHENGKKHIENMKKHLKERQANKMKQEKQQTELERSLLQMERIANSKAAQDAKFFGGVKSTNTNVVLASTPVSTSGNLSNIYPNIHLKSESQPQIEGKPPFESTNMFKKQSSNTDKQMSKKEKESWQDRKKRRDEDRKHNSNIQSHDEGNISPFRRKKKIHLGENEGHYIIDDHTYLEGNIYAPLFIKDMPIQIWTGAATAKSIDLQKVENQVYWKTGLLCKISKQPSGDDDDRDVDSNDDDKFFCDVAYLLNPSDDDETFESNVPSNRLRILVGSGNRSEDGIPNSLEEARLDLMGGEEVIENDATAETGAQDIVDENTGFSGWNTVSIRKVTVNKELKEERARLRAKRQFEHELQEKNKKDIEERKMEEARYANADDSALGAYDVWNVTSQAKGGGYKGVDINSEAKVDHVADSVSQLSKGKASVTFKKKKKFGDAEDGGKMKKKKFRRVTSADD